MRANGSSICARKGKANLGHFPSSAAVVEIRERNWRRESSRQFPLTEGNWSGEKESQLDVT